MLSDYFGLGLVLMLVDALLLLVKSGRQKIRNPTKAVAFYAASMRIVIKQLCR